MPKQSTDDAYLDVAELGTRWRYHTKSIRKRIDDGDFPIPVYRIMGGIRFKLADVIEHERQATSDAMIEAGKAKHRKRVAKKDVPVPEAS